MRFLKKDFWIRTILFVLCIFVTTMWYTFFVIPRIRKEEAEKVRNAAGAEDPEVISVLIYCGQAPLLPGNIFSKQQEAQFTAYSIPKKYITGEVPNNYSEVIGNSLRYTLLPGQMLLAEMVGGDPEFFSEDLFLFEVSVAGIVGNQVTAGTWVDVLTVYKDGTYAVVLSKVRVYYIQKPDDTSFGQNGNGSYEIVFALREEQYQDVLSASLEGMLTTRLYFESSPDHSEQNYIRPKNGGSHSEEEH